VDFSRAAVCRYGDAPKPGSPIFPSPGTVPVARNQHHVAFPSTGSFPACLGDATGDILHRPITACKFGCLDYRRARLPGSRRCVTAVILHWHIAQAARSRMNIIENTGFCSLLLELVSAVSLPGFAAPCLPRHTAARGTLTSSAFPAHPHRRLKAGIQAGGIPGRRAASACRSCRGNRSGSDPHRIESSCCLPPQLALGLEAGLSVQIRDRCEMCAPSLSGVPGVHAKVSSWLAVVSPIFTRCRRRNHRPCRCPTARIGLLLRRSSAARRRDHRPAIPPSHGL